MKRPFVCVNMAISIDGKITSYAKEAAHFTSAYDRCKMDQYRAEADALIVGAQTIRADNPNLGVRTPNMQQYRASLGKPKALKTVVVTRSCQLLEAQRFLQEQEQVYKIIATTSQHQHPELEPSIHEMWRFQQSTDVPIQELLERLYQTGVQQVLLEGGGALNWLFVEQDLIDRYYLTVAPTLIGGEHAPTMLEGKGFLLSERLPLTLIAVHQEGSELYCTYERQR